MPWKQEERLESPNPLTSFSLQEVLIFILGWSQEHVPKGVGCSSTPCIGSVPVSLVILEVIFFNLFALLQTITQTKAMTWMGGAAYLFIQ